MASNDDVFRNTLANDTRMMMAFLSCYICDVVEGGFFSARRLTKLEILRKDRKTPLYPGCTMNKLQVYISCY